MKSLIRFVLVLAIGAAIGYLLHPTIDTWVKGSPVENLAEEGSKLLNEVVPNDSTETEIPE